MKKTLLVGLAIGLVSMAATAAFAGKSPVRAIPAQGLGANQAAAWGAGANYGGSGIIGSSHDLSDTAAQGLTGPSGKAQSYTTQDAQSRICVYCHHPHNSLKAGTGSGVTGVGAYSPLWNRNMSTVPFAAYNNGFMGNASTAQHTLNAGSNVLSGVSLLCMSCHDGVVAMDAYSQNSGSEENAGSGTGSAITGSAAFNGASSGANQYNSGINDMSNHHPMGFTYATVQGADSEIADPATIMVPAGASIAGMTEAAVIAAGGVTINDLLDATQTGGKMECVTCHDVHNTKNAPGAERFLWRSNNQSNFCLTCHLK